MHSHELVEALAAIVLIASGLVLVPAAWLAQRRRAAGHGSVVRTVSSRPLHYALRFHAGTAAALALGASLIHFAVAPEHYAEYPPSGVASIAVGATQAALAVAFATAGVGRLRVPGIAITLGVLAVWAWSRTMGLPIGPDPWVRDGLGMADSIAAILEAALVLVLLVPIRRFAADLGRERVVDAMSVAIVPLIGSVGIVTLIAIASVMPVGHH